MRSTNGRRNLACVASVLPLLPILLDHKFVWGGRGEELSFVNKFLRSPQFSRGRKSKSLVSTETLATQLSETRHCREMYWRLFPLSAFVSMTISFISISWLNHLISKSRSCVFISWLCLDIFTNVKRGNENCLSTLVQWPPTLNRGDRRVEKHCPAITGTPRGRTVSTIRSFLGFLRNKTNYCLVHCKLLLQFRKRKRLPRGLATSSWAWSLTIMEVLACSVNNCYTLFHKHHQNWMFSKKPLANILEAIIAISFCVMGFLMRAALISVSAAGACVASMPRDINHSRFLKTFTLYQGGNIFRRWPTARKHFPRIGWVMYSTNAVVGVKTAKSNLFYLCFSLNYQVTGRKSYELLIYCRPNVW